MTRQLIEVSSLRSPAPRSARDGDNLEDDWLEENQMMFTSASCLSCRGMFSTVLRSGCSCLYPIQRDLMEYIDSPAFFEVAPGAAGAGSAASRLVQKEREV